MGSGAGVAREEGSGAGDVRRAAADFGDAGARDAPRDWARAGGDGERSLAGAGVSSRSGDLTWSATAVFV